MKKKASSWGDWAHPLHPPSPGGGEGEEVYALSFCAIPDCPARQLTKHMEQATH